MISIHAAQGRSPTGAGTVLEYVIHEIFGCQLHKELELKVNAFASAMPQNLNRQKSPITIYLNHAIT